MMIIRLIVNDGSVFWPGYEICFEYHTCLEAITCLFPASLGHTEEEVRTSLALGLAQPLQTWPRLLHIAARLRQSYLPGACMPAL